MIRVEVVYALPLAQDICPLEVPEGTTIKEAILLTRHAQCDLATHSLAVYGRPATADTVLREGDRIEILRPLQVDPKLARKRRQSRRRGGR
jgi:putative ubiquitin-RnfH superfamily antitoxin RatB of RatAB toxin-antitoxin module